MSFKDQLLKYTPRSIKDGVKKALDSDLKWRYVDNFGSVLRHQMHGQLETEEEKKVLHDLNQDGIAVSHIDHLFPDCYYLKRMQQEWQDLEERYSREIEAYRQGGKEEDRGKRYLYRFFDQAKDLQRENLSMDSIAKLIAQSSVYHRIASAYLGMESELFYFDYWLTMQNQSESRSQFWHRDEDDHMEVKFFIYLNKVDEGAGPFQYVKNTHVKGKIKDEPHWFREEGYSAYRASDEDLEKSIPREHWLSLCGEPGDLLVVDTRGIHKGGLAREHDRKFFISAYASKTCEVAGQYKA